MGSEIKMNDNGDSEGNFSVLSLQPGCNYSFVRANRSTTLFCDECMQPIGQFHLIGEKLPVSVVFCLMSRPLIIICHHNVRNWLHFSESLKIRGGGKLKMLPNFVFCRVFAERKTWQGKNWCILGYFWTKTYLYVWARLKLRGRADFWGYLHLD